MYPRPCTRCHGFTLLELMVVLVLMGIILSMMTISVGDGGLYRDMEEEANRFKTLTAMARDEAILRSQDWIIVFKKDGYQFEVETYEDDKGTKRRKWSPIKDKVFRERPLPDYQLSLLIEDTAYFPDPEKVEGEAEEDIIGRVYLWSSGEMTGFEFTLRHDNSEDYFVIKADEAGELAIKRSRDEAL